MFAYRFVSAYQYIRNIAWTQYSFYFLTKAGTDPYDVRFYIDHHIKTFVRKWKFFSIALYIIQTLCNYFLFEGFTGIVMICQGQ
jgi:hypothetical protein